MSYSKEMNNILNLQKMNKASTNALTSNLSFICKENSTISLFVCVPTN